MIEKTIIAVLRKTPTFHNTRFLKLKADRGSVWPEVEGYGADVANWHSGRSCIDYSLLPACNSYWDWYGDQLGVSPYNGEVWPKDYD